MLLPDTRPQTRALLNAIPPGLLPLLAMLCLLGAVTSARAQQTSNSYGSAQYTGGTHTSQGTGSVLDALGNGGSYGGGDTYNNVCSLAATGGITASFAWTGPSAPPQSVVVVQSCVASWSSGGATAPIGTCDDGLHDPMNVTQTNPHAAGGASGEDANGNSISHYSLLAGAQTLPLDPVGATATITGVAGTGVSANVSYTAAVHPVTIDLTGTDTSTGANEALTGQQVTATLNLHGAPLAAGTTPTYSWSQANTNLFKNWSEKTIPQMTPLSSGTPSDYTSQAFAFYDATAEAVTLTCTVTFTTPDGVSHSPTITSQSVTFMKPTVTAWGINTGTGVQAGLQSGYRAGKFEP